MSTTDFTAPPRLAVGSHPGSKTYMCAMNVISWENGDKDITDFPACTPRPLARMVQMVNDTYCRHITSELDPHTGRRVSVLCAPCSVKMLNLAHRTVHLPTPTYAGGWGWMADMLKAAQRSAYSVAELEVLREAQRVAAARSAGIAPECPAPLPPVAISVHMTQLAKSIIATERAMFERTEVAPVEVWMPAGLGDEMVSFIPKSSTWKLLAVAKAMNTNAFPPGVTPGAHYLPEMHYVRPPRDLINMAGAHFVSGHGSRKVTLGRAHDAIGMWTQNAVRTTPPGVFAHPAESVAA